jgi:hypothetical protein
MMACFQEEKERKLIRVRLEMAKFLQDTLRESPLKSNAKIIGTEEFKEFFQKVQNFGMVASVELIAYLRFALPEINPPRKISSM